jgi:ComF family protein
MGLKSWLLDLLFPVECLGCRQEGAWLCDTCLRQIKFNGPGKGANLIAPDLDKIFIAGDYDDPLLADSLKKFKYNFLTALGQPLSRFLIMFWQGQLTLPENAKLNSGNAKLNSEVDSALLAAAAGPIADTILIPIPLSKKRLRWRGFNQAEIIARALGEAFAYPLNFALHRKNRTAPQASLNESDRATNIQGSFVWTGPNLSGQTIILIDDVVTTGATLNEAAKILRAAGAGQVYGLVLAKG